MLKSFFNGFSGGLGRTFGRLLAYIIFGLLAFILIYYTSKETDYNLSDLLFMRVDAASAVYGRDSCSSTYYNIEKMNGDVSYGQTSTSYNISWAFINFYGTENLKANTYYDLVITFRSNISNNIFNTTGDNEGLRGMHLFQNSSLCGADIGEASITSYNISGSKLTVRILTGPTLYDYWQWYQRFTFVGSNGINSVVFTEVDLTGSSGIIENANDNTNNIINNNNENTQDIIDNQTQNTQDIINALDNNNFSVCSHGKQYFLIGSDKSYISTSNGRVSPVNNYFVSSPLRIEPNQSYTLSLVDATNIKYGYYCFYRSDKTLISCTKYVDNETLTYTFTSPNDSYYFLATLLRSNDVLLNAYLEGQNANICVTDTYNNSIISQKNNISLDDLNNEQQQTNSKLDQMLAMPTVRLILFSNSIQEWSNWINNPVASFVTLPVDLVSKINTISQSSCTPFNLGSLFNTNLSFECFTLSDFLPSALVNIIDIISCISLSFVIVKRIYETVSNLITLGGENEVKSYFKVPTPLEFMASFF